ncbi:hypothetical protein M2157_007834 [Streptomyces sp. SAI-127]|nr:hypothetical protein [Streptomyces sp. SAI-127]
MAPPPSPSQWAEPLATLDTAGGGRVPAEIIDVCRAVWCPDPVRYEDRQTRTPPRPPPVWSLWQRRLRGWTQDAQEPRDVAAEPYKKARAAGF